MKHALAGLAVLATTIAAIVPAKATNCVTYVKAATGFSLYGDAWQWWGAAANVYERGFMPAAGAVMVFSRTGHMHVGHVAVVRRVLGPREILIDHANWHHGRIDHDVSIHDLSPNNDWSSVEVEWSRGVYGGPFPITGFVYAPGTPLPSDPAPAFVERDRGPNLIEASARGATGRVVLAGGRTMLATRAGAHTAILSAAAPHHPAQAARPASTAAAAPIHPAKPVVALGAAAKPAVAARHTPVTATKAAVSAKAASTRH